MPGTPGDGAGSRAARPQGRMPEAGSLDTATKIARIATLNEIDRDILRLALPALGALVAEPLFLLTDTALVGHLGAVPLAGLSIGGAILQTLIGLLIFLAYATTPAVARRLGAGDTVGAIRAGIDGMWLALAIGVVLVAVGVPTSGWLVGLFGATPEVSAAAHTYFSISLWGIPGMLLVIAATGLLRGLQDTKTPLVVATVGFGANAALSALFIYGFGWGIAGSAIGTVVAQWAMAAVYLRHRRAGQSQSGREAAAGLPWRRQRGPVRNVAARPHRQPARGDARDGLRGRPTSA